MKHINVPWFKMTTVLLSTFSQIQMISTGLVLAKENRPCMVQGNSSAMFSIVEGRCANNQQSIRFFKVLVDQPGAEEIYTSVISPFNASCSGIGSSFICTAPLDTVVVYNTFSGIGCLPDIKNNNFADTSTRFSKHIIVCKPCLAGKEYWIGLQLLNESMSCSFKMALPRYRLNHPDMTLSRLFPLIYQHDFLSLLAKIHFHRISTHCRIITK